MRLIAGFDRGIGMYDFEYGLIDWLTREPFLPVGHRLNDGRVDRSGVFTNGRPNCRGQSAGNLTYLCCVRWSGFEFIDGQQCKAGLVCRAARVGTISRKRASAEN